VETTDLRAAMQHKRLISEPEAYRLATPAQRAHWWPAGEPADGKAHGYGAGAGWGSSPAEPADRAEIMASLAGLAEQERWAEAHWLGRVIDETAAALVSWSIANKPDIHAVPERSEAERRRRALADLDTIAGRHR
jgi:hypothetical protein